MLYKLYVGSNNKTKKLEKAKAIKIVSVFFDGFTASTGQGYWKGKPEKSLMLEIDTLNEDKVFSVIKILKAQLKQDTIGLARFSNLEFI